MTERLLSPSVRDLYAALKIFSDHGQGIPQAAVPDLMIVALTLRALAEELEDELHLATRLLKAGRSLGGKGDVGKVVRLPCRSRPRPVDPDGGDAA